MAVVLITGTSSGIGLATALQFARSGNKVYATMRNPETGSAALKAAAKAGHLKLHIAQLDVTDAASVERAVDAILVEAGRVDVLVNNAGISWGEPIETMPVEKWRQVFETNATGCFLMSQAAGREMLRAGRGGSIINIASVVGLVGTPADVLDGIGYSASKGAIVAFTRDLAVKWAPKGIRVNAIAPGFFDTRLSHALLEKTQRKVEQTTPMGRIGQPGELQGAAIFLASAASSYVTGQVLVVDGGMTAR
jgi:NAD(P)-dependent dehydrogenase (short-subunit alcohol dehydrogenase family)